MTPMVVQCSSCLTEFELDPHKVPANGVRARCSVCSAVISVPAPPREGAEEPAEARAEEQQPIATTAAPDRHATPEQPATSAEQEGASGQSPAAPPGAAATQAAPAGAGASAPSATSGAPPSPGGSSHAAPSETPAGGVSRRPINPFLSRDPALRAKRLARALVSDIVAYHPARHAEGLREGTLKTLFRDEIKKSYEEYVDQVGRDFASSTTHFQDALNDVLAGGKKLF